MKALALCDPFLPTCNNRHIIAFINFLVLVKSRGPAFAFEKGRAVVGGREYANPGSCLHFKLYYYLYICFSIYFRQINMVTPCLGRKFFRTSCFSRHFLKQITNNVICYSNRTLKNDSFVKRVLPSTNSKVWGVNYDILFKSISTTNRYI